MESYDLISNEPIIFEANSNYFISIERIFLENITIKQILDNNLKIELTVGNTKLDNYLAMYFNPELKYNTDFIILDITDFNIQRDPQNDLGDTSKIKIKVFSETNNDCKFKCKIFLNKSFNLK